jgi:hypothetical protein
MASGTSDEVPIKIRISSPRKTPKKSRKSGENLEVVKIKTKSEEIKVESEAIKIEKNYVECGN